MITLEKIQSMMRFLGKTQYVIPDYQLPPIPELSSKENYRPLKTFRLSLNGTMTYEGHGYSVAPSLQDKIPENSRRSVYIYNMETPPEYLARAYSQLIDDCRKHLRLYTYRSKIKDIKYLICVFHNIEYVFE